MRRWLPFVVALALAGLLHGAESPHQNPVLIANTSVPLEAISANDLKGLYLREKATVQNCPLRPAMLNGSIDRTGFSRLYLGKDGTALRLYYRSLVFSGRADIPVQFDSEEKLISFVRKTPNAIGYISGGAQATLDRAVKTIPVR